jgi:predicted RNA binding protein YcfA (HicA-like mRNA interferase family)
MGTHAKTLAKMRSNPLDWRIGELLSVAAHYGIEVRNDGGSHHVFSHPSLPQTVCVPAHRPIKPVYVRQFVALIDQIKESSS